MIAVRLALVGCLSLACARGAAAHATYNLSGYGAGLAGSTNGADGSPAGPTAAWTNGPVSDYAGALPVTWYSGLHDATQVRTVQSGAGASPPAGSLLTQAVAYNVASDPDLPTDAVLAVGGRSWSDPVNADQGWGHGLDYGLIHVSPVAEVLADGPVSLTITLGDDPTDAAAVRLAFALYAGWDTSTTAERHQTFVTTPSPLDDPFGASGLRLIDFAVASAPGATLSRSYEIDPATDGKYTLLVGALGGVPGQYQVTTGLFPTGAALNAELATCRTDLDGARTALDTATRDADADGVPDQRDGCPATAAGQLVDGAGCTQAEFCAGIATGTKAGRKACKQADWNNDEPTMKAKQADCRFDRSAGTCAAAP